MDIETDLRRWAAWARESLNLGIKSLVMFDDGLRDKVAFFPMSDDEASAFDPAVATLKQIDKELYNVVRLHYIYGKSMRAIAMITGMKITAVHSALHTAKTFIHGFTRGVTHESAKQALRIR
ncbi:antiterminator Q family protein [Leclercia sp. Marseille-Q4284]|uniref:antiterminator Q family protein n=1 Tax=Leclercia sp. Marseille-Q4284 TaxID=2866582 RepID=UPI001CE4452B|nr:antiterminator Q family protein [Leclercia sp. Marseille-Q4284]